MAPRHQQCAPRAGWWRAIVLGHISFGVADLMKATAFYDGVLGTLGYVRVWSGFLVL